jgi:4-hydroxythreonine-4-phosphate dehydrogenase
MQSRIAHKSVLITPGDPAGIGPEIALRTFVSGLRNIVLMGDIAHLTSVAQNCGLDIIFAPYNRDAPDGTCRVMEMDWPADIVTGAPDSRNAPAIIEAISRGVALTKDNIFSAVVTNPIAKSVLYKAGFIHRGHTEFLAALDTATATPVMMLANDQLKIVPLTIHIPLSEVEDSISDAAITKTITIIDKDLKHRFGLNQPRIAVAGLNPHAGENGYIGGFERDRLTPLLTALKSKGFSITGPHSADSLFHEAAREQYDVVLAMYHDQALIPVKTIDFHNSVNVTLGLSFIRTSPDHGTAFDIAPQFSARPDSLIAAVKIAGQMAGQIVPPQYSPVLGQ